MAQTIILAAATTAGTSTDVTLAAGVYGRVSIYSATGQIPFYTNLELRTDTGGADALMTILNAQQQTVQLIGPGVFRVYRPPQEVAIGVSSET